MIVLHRQSINFITVQYMSKKLVPLSEEERGRLFYGLCVALVKLKDVSEASELLQDLFTLKESEMIARRLKIAEFLLRGESYNTIREDLGSGFTTIARVQEWLTVSGSGYRKAVEKVKISGGKFMKKSLLEQEKTALWEKKQEDFRSAKRRYPMYYWPQILLENMVRGSNKRQLEQMESVLKNMEQLKKKPEVYKRLKNLLRKKKIS